MSRFVKPEKNRKRTSVIVLIGSFLMIVLYAATGRLDFTPTAPRNTAVISMQEAQILSETGTTQPDFVYEEATPDLLQPEKGVIKDKTIEPEEPQIKAAHIPVVKPVEKEIEKPKKAPPPIAYQGGRRRIVIIIDDMGMDRKHSRQIMNMQAPLTLAFLPYAPGVREMAMEAKSMGHELLIHMPMEAMNPYMNLGAIALTSNMNQEQIINELNKAFESFDGYVGINNHMGSKLTQNEPIMRIVMDALKTRNLLYVDSKTIQSSIAEDVAAAAGIAHAGRDVFLDHEDNIHFVRNALYELEKVASRQSVAIAIGHPKAATIQGLEEWLPTLKDKNIEIIPVSAAVRPAHIETVAKVSADPVMIEPSSGFISYGPYQKIQDSRIQGPVQLP